MYTRSIRSPVRASTSVMNPSAAPIALEGVAGDLVLDHARHERPRERRPRVDLLDLHRRARRHAVDVARALEDLREPRRRQGEQGKRREPDDGSGGPRCETSPPVGALTHTRPLASVDRDMLDRRPTPGEVP
jgi:hypothetical protein